MHLMSGSSGARKRLGGVREHREVSRTNGSTINRGAASPMIASRRTSRPKVEASQDEFGGPLGACIIIVVSHCVVYGLFLSLEVGMSPFPQSGEALGAYASRVGGGLSEAAPTLEGFVLYFGFLVATAVLSMILPGVTVRGRPLPSLDGECLDYLCNGVGVPTTSASDARHSAR